MVPFSESYQLVFATGSSMTHEIKRTYRYRLYPDEAQKAELARTFGCSRWVYNWALETKTKAYYQDKESLSLTDLSGRPTDKKPLGVRDWTCSECGTHHDRDINAAKNLSRVGQIRIQAPGQLDKTDAFEVVGTAG